MNIQYYIMRLLTVLVLFGGILTWYRMLRSGVPRVYRAAMAVGVLFTGTHLDDFQFISPPALLASMEGYRTPRPWMLLVGVVCLGVGIYGFIKTRRAHNKPLQPHAE